MSIFFNIVAVLLLISGIYHIYEGIKYRNCSANYRLGKFKIPYWIPKIGASVFIIGLAIHTLLI